MVYWSISEATSGIINQAWESVKNTSSQSKSIWLYNATLLVIIGILKYKINKAINNRKTIQSDSGPIEINWTLVEQFLEDNNQAFFHADYGWDDQLQSPAYTVTYTKHSDKLAIQVAKLGSNIIRNGTSSYNTDNIKTTLQSLLCGPCEEGGD